MKSRAPEASGDADLIKAAKTGDQRAFSALVARYEETVYRFSFKICRDREKAEETLQDTFVNVFRKLESFDGKSKFSTWLYTIVTRNCLMKLRKTKMRSAEEPLEIFDGTSTDQQGRGKEIATWEANPSEVLLDKELRTLLDRSIGKLPEEYRVVFVLRDVEGRSTQETAKILRLTQEATKSRLRRARAFLREELNPYMVSRGGKK
jgi:RNA polymerase sigma-70 factor, ECF subfamily